MTTGNFQNVFLYRIICVNEYFIPENFSGHFGIDYGMLLCETRGYPARRENLAQRVLTRVTT